jgi:hypothetical protein
MAVNRSAEFPSRANRFEYVPKRKNERNGPEREQAISHRRVLEQCATDADHKTANSEHDYHGSFGLPIEDYAGGIRVGSGHGMICIR